MSFNFCYVVFFRGSFLLRPSFGMFVGHHLFLSPPQMPKMAPDTFPRNNSTLLSSNSPSNHHQALSPALIPSTQPTLILPTLILIICHRLPLGHWRKDPKTVYMPLYKAAGIPKPPYSELANTERVSFKRTD